MNRCRSTYRRAFLNSTLSYLRTVVIPQTRISEILKERRRITTDTALRLSKYFGNSQKFWLGLQDDYDIEQEKLLKEKEFEAIVQYTEVA